MRRAGRCAARAERAGGFTIVELLVVITIISLLISLLMPGLARVRDTVRQVICGGRMRQITIAITTYSEENQGWLVGGPTTSGADALDGRFSGVAIQTWDYIGPLAQSLGYTGPGDGEGSTIFDETLRAARFDWYRNDLDLFACPSNTVTAKPFIPSSIWTEGRMLPFNMSTQFTSTTDPIPKGTGGHWAQKRTGYSPRIDRVGTPHLKTALFEGHRYATIFQKPDFDQRFDAPYGGAFGGVGGWWNESKELNRAAAPGEPGRDLYLLNPSLYNDARRWAFRHGFRTDKGLGTAMVLGNMAFFDGHVALMTDGDATDPDLWFPTGTRIESGWDFWAHARETWPNKLLDRTPLNPYTVP